MLEKHICRHVQDCLKSGNQYSCLKCTFETSDQKMVFEHLKIHQRQAVEEEIALSKQEDKKSAKMNLPKIPFATSEIHQKCNLAALQQQSTELLKQNPTAFVTNSLAFQLTLQQLFKNGFPVMTNSSTVSSTVSSTFSSTVSSTTHPLNSSPKTMDLTDEENEHKLSSLFQESS